MRSVFLVAAALLATAVFISPLEPLASIYLASAHVVKHLLLNFIVPLLVVLGIPPPVGKRLRVPVVVAWCAGTVSLIVWYVPALYNAALGRVGPEMLQAATWVLGGALFFLPLYNPARERRMKAVPAGVLYLFAAAVVASVAGLRLATLPPGPYGSYAAPKDPLHILNALQNTWHFDPEDDQQTAGFVFWLGSCLVYLWSVMVMFYRMVAGEGSKGR
ncbi:MAG TPA: cytochrome c oxidase assembly protein [Bryobacteraceae bacterium]|nr:cytochrome c oxidase assembly protein [Bryobacteraceae bacterium]